MQIPLVLDFPDERLLEILHTMIYNKVVPWLTIGEFHYFKDDPLPFITGSAVRKGWSDSPKCVALLHHGNLLCVYDGRDEKARKHRVRVHLVHLQRTVGYIFQHNLKLYAKIATASTNTNVLTVEQFAEALFLASRRQPSSLLTVATHVE